MQFLSSTNLEPHREGKDRSKSNSKQRDNERRAVEEHSAGVGQVGFLSLATRRLVTNTILRGLKCHSKEFYMRSRET